MKFAALSDTGMVRAHNEDAWEVASAPDLWVLSDGVGGQAAGEVASRIAVQTVVEHWRRCPPAEDLWITLGSLRDAVQAAHQQVQAAASQPDRQGMAATLLAATVQMGFYCLAHVGDSRAYLLREGRLERITRDHTVTQLLVSQGLLTAQEAASEPGRHALAQALGHGTIIADLYCGRWEPSDLLLLCSDGLYDMLPDHAIAELLERYGARPEQACQALVEAANQAGGRDNVTVMVVVGDAFAATTQEPAAPVSPSSSFPPSLYASPPRRPRTARLWLGAAAFLVAGIALFAIGHRLSTHWVLDLESQPARIRNRLPIRWPGSQVDLPYFQSDVAAELANWCGLGAEYAALQQHAFSSPQQAQQALLTLASRLIAAATEEDSPSDPAAARKRSLAVRLAESLKTGNLTRQGNADAFHVPVQPSNQKDRAPSDK